MSKSIITYYKRYRFRSRLEATWAAFFDSLGWQWEYEPFDLNGYIPDFVLKFYKPLLVEVKPVIDTSEFAQFREKIDLSGWNHEAMIVGATIFNEAVYGPVIGEICERFEDGEAAWNGAEIFRCSECRKASVHSESLIWTCRVCGAYDGDHYCEMVSKNEIEPLWAEAKNAAQWVPLREAC